MSLLSGCQQVCVNTIGGFQCECTAGFQLNLDNSTCSGNTVYIVFNWVYCLSIKYLFTDIDECADTSLCGHTCINTNGSFNCLCDDGYSLADDGRTCMDINECSPDLNRCQQSCVNTEGSFRCQCNSGFQLNSDQTTCTGMERTPIKFHVSTSLISYRY